MLSANEIAAAALADQGGAFNPQQQYPVRWPAEPVVARAYADQLKRADALDPRLRRAARSDATRSRRSLRAECPRPGPRPASARPGRSQPGFTADQRRHAALAEVLEQIAARLG